MKKTIGQATGKLILSGEYAVVFGYPGIAIPAPFAVTATWEQLPLTLALSRREREMCHHDLVLRYSGIENEAYLHHILEEVQKYTGPLNGHLTIENTIPIGRGMGSSTALVIAICRCLLGHPPLPFKGEDKGEGYKQIALSIETTVNPGHSGIDFDVVWNEKPILFQKGKPTKILDIPINLLMGTCSSQVLIDTGKPHETTAEMIALVTELIGIPSPRGGGSGRGGPLPKGGGILALQTIAHCTERLLAGESPLTVFRDHHRAQAALGIVPEPVQALIADIEKAGGAAKVVGAGGRSGGGGIVLAMHKHFSDIQHLAKSHGFSITTLSRTATLTSDKH